MSFKKTYTKAEIDDLVAWIDTNPTHDGPLDLGHGIVVSDLDKFLHNMRGIALTHFENPSFTGQIQLLEQVRQFLERA